MNRDPYNKVRSNRAAAIAFGVASLLGVSGCGQKVDGQALAAPATSTEITTAAPSSTATAAPSTTNKNDCTYLNGYHDVVAANGANRKTLVNSADCGDKSVAIYNEQDQVIGQLPDKSEFDIICSAADTVVNPTFKIHSDNPPLDGRVHLSPTIAAQEVTDYSLPNC